MNKSGRVLGLMVSVLFAVSAVVIGALYDSNRANQLELTSNSSAKNVKDKDTGKDITIDSSSKTTKTSETTKDSAGGKTAEEKTAEELISRILVQGQVQSDFTLDDYKQKKKAIPILTRHGTLNVPLIVFADENLDEYAAIWSETNPDWKLEIERILIRE